jgi:hypothetical protein
MQFAVDSLQITAKTAELGAVLGLHRGVAARRLQKFVSRPNPAGVTVRFCGPSGARGAPFYAKHKS